MNDASVYSSAVFFLIVVVVPNRSAGWSRSWNAWPTRLSGSPTAARAARTLGRVRLTGFERSEEMP